MTIQTRRDRLARMFGPEARTEIVLSILNAGSSLNDIEAAVVPVVARPGSRMQEEADKDEDEGASKDPDAEEVEEEDEDLDDEEDLDDDEDEDEDDDLDDDDDDDEDEDDAFGEDDD